MLPALKKSVTTNPDWPFTQLVMSVHVLRFVEYCACHLTWIFVPFVDVQLIAGVAPKGTIIPIITGFGGFVLTTTAETGM
jgi:hypothetical protein